VAAENWPTIRFPARGAVRPHAAISPDARADEMLSALAHNVVTNGTGVAQHEALEPTEFLKLVHRYLSQARELDKLAGDGKVIQIASCDSANVADLLRILATACARLRLGGGAGDRQRSARVPDHDSGFPLNDLEQALRTNHPSPTISTALARCSSGGSTG